MKEVPSVTMKAGTFSLAMIVPLTRPTTAAPATAARKPERHRQGNSGTPALNDARMACAESTEARLITQPTREVDAGGDDDEGLPEAEQQDRRDRDEDVLRVADGEEGGAA